MTFEGKLVIDYVEIFNFRVDASLGGAIYKYTCLKMPRILKDVIQPWTLQLTSLTFLCI